MYKYSEGQKSVLKEFETDDKFDSLADSVEDVANDGNTMEFLILHDLFEREWNVICSHLGGKDIPYYSKHNINEDDFGIFTVVDFVCNISHKDEILKCFQVVYSNKSNDEIENIFKQRTSWNKYESLSQHEKDEYLKERYFSFEDYEEAKSSEIKQKILEKIREDFADSQTTSFSKEDSDDYPFGDDYY